MRVVSIVLTNFASYKNLEFNFTEKGLTLIHGATGSGKSTLCDAIPWCLFGVTAKGGKVDEVLSWPGNEKATGVITLDLNGKMFQVIRSRNPNDLAIWEDGGVYRGKDATDTQKLINNSLGMDYELFLSGSYFHEFSQTAQFFTTTAKNRRAMCEQLVDLSLPKKIQDKSKLKIKELEEFVKHSTAQVSGLRHSLETLRKVQFVENNKAHNWEKVRKDFIAKTELAVTEFERNRHQRMEVAAKKEAEKAAAKKCSECGAVKLATHKHQGNNEEVARISAETNFYIKRLEDLRQEVNPHTGSVTDYSVEIAHKTDSLEEYQSRLLRLESEITDLNLLQDVNQSFRGLLIKNTILDIEGKTNVLLSSHFDAEIKVELAIEDDKLEINLIKDGNQCSFTQLSKGQRQMLKLCFGVAVMTAVSNHHGIDFSQVFLDECADGMDENTKLKAMKLLEELSLKHELVFVVEHSETFKAMVLNKIKVELINGNSAINGD